MAQEWSQKAYDILPIPGFWWLMESSVICSAVVVAIGLRTGWIASGYNCPTFLQGTTPATSATSTPTTTNNEGETM